MDFNWYLKEVKKNPEIRTISKRTWIVYKSKFWSAKKTLEYLTRKNDYSINRTGKFKIPKSAIIELQKEVEQWIDKNLIAKKYKITVRCVYRYRDLILTINED